MQSPNLDYLWQQILDIIKSNLSEPLWNSSFAGSVAPLSLVDDALEIGLFVSYKKDIILKNPLIFNALSKSIQEVMPSVTSIIFTDLTTSIQSTHPLIIENNTFKITEKIPSSMHQTIEIETSPTIYDSIKDYEPTKKDNSIPIDYDIPSYGTPVEINKTEPKPSYNYESNSLFPPIIEPSIPIQRNEIIDIHLRENKLNKDFTFNTFISGAANRMPFATAQNVAEFPGSSYNPLYIYGKPGLGKTHLMHAIGNYIKQTKPDARILYTTSENFLNFFISAIKNKKNELFRNKFRNVDVLLIDDIQFLENGNFESTKEEFFHTFNSLLEYGSQIVLTSDVVPDDFKKIENRLISRFKAGIVVEITSPDPEIIMAILMNYIDNEREKHPELYIPNEVIQFFGTYFEKQSIRDLQGAFKRLIMRASVDNRLSSINVEYTQEVLHDLLPKIEKAILSISFIQNFVASYYNMPLETMLGNTRRTNIVIPRQIAMYLCRILLNESYPQISNAFGKKDHSTSLKAVENVNKKIEKDIEFRQTITDIKNRIYELI